jgi:hypothetical protein
MKKKMIFKGIAELLVLIAAAIVGANLVILVKQEGGTLGVVPTAYDIAVLIAVVAVFRQCPTPYDDDDPGRTLGAAAIVVSCSRMLYDIAFMSTAVSMALSEAIDLAGNVKDDSVTLQAISYDSSDVVWILGLVLASKATLLVLGVYLVISGGRGVVLRTKTKKQLPAIMSFLFACSLTAYLYINDMQCPLHFGPSALRATLGGWSESVAGWIDECGYIAAAVVFGKSGQPLLGAFVFVSISVRVHFAGDDGPIFLASFALALMCAGAAVSVVVRAALSVHVHRLLYQLSICASLLAVAFFFISISLPWITFAIKPQLPPGIMDMFDTVVDTFVLVTRKLYEVVKTLNPCLAQLKLPARLQNASQESVGSFNAMSGIDEGMTNARCDLKTTHGTCFDVGEICPFKKKKNVEVGVCQDMADAQKEYTGAMASYAPPGDDFDFDPDVENITADEESFFEQPGGPCQIIICATIISLSAAALAAAVIPFGGDLALCQENGLVDCETKAW